MKKLFFVLCLLTSAAFADEKGGSLHFYLHDYARKAVTETNYAGEYKLVMLGTSHCRQVCGVGLITMEQVLQKFTGSPTKVTALFIGTDAKRDTPAALKEYIGHFNNKIIGLSGNAKQIKEVSSVLANLTQGNSTQNKNPVYLSYIYLISPDGHYIARFQHDANAEDIVKVLNGNI
jgi:protein SCO1/2